MPSANSLCDWLSSKSSFILSGSRSNAVLDSKVVVATCVDQELHGFPLYPAGWEIAGLAGPFDYLAVVPCVSPIDGWSIGQGV